MNFAILIHVFIIIMMTMQKLTFENSEEKNNQGHSEKCSHFIFREICDFSKYFKSLVIKSVITERRQLLIRTKNLYTCQPIITQSYYVKPILTLNQFWHDMHCKFWHIYVFNILANVKSNTVDLKATLEYQFIDKSQKYMFEKILS